MTTTRDASTILGSDGPSALAKSGASGASASGALASGALASGASWRRHSCLASARCIAHSAPRNGPRPASLLVLAASASFAAAASPALAGPPEDLANLPNLVEVGGHAPDRVLVQLAPGVQAAKNARGEPLFSMPGLAADARTRRESRATLAAVGAKSMRGLLLAPPKDLVTARAIGLDRWQVVELAAGADPVAAMARLAKTPGVARAELDPEGGLAEIPNDSDFFVQYALRNTGQVVNGLPGTAGADVKATTAWDYTHGDPNLVIAVLDSGITPHPELAGRILPGINVPDNTTITTDECNHGTHVAGILAATGGNGTGIAGMTWNAKLLPVVVVNGCTGFESNVATGLTWAVDQGARLVNMSLQFYAGSAVFQQAVQYAHAQGALVVAATGNNGNSTIAAPARWNETIAVAATDNNDLRASFSNFGAETDLSAPGVSVWSLSSSGGYTFKSGTSMSVPHVTGAAALLWSYAPQLTRDQVRSLLVQSAVDLGAPGTDTLYGAGRLDATAALALVPQPAPEDLNGDGLVDAADLSALLLAWGACVDCDGGCPADFDGNCIVDAADLSRILIAWGG